MAYKGFSKHKLSPKDIQGYEEYLQALFKYKRECKTYKQLSLKYKLAAAPEERLIFLEAKEQYRIACKEYSEARFKYAAALARGREITPVTDAELVMRAAAMGAQLPMSTAQIIQAEKEATADRYWEEHPEEFEELKLKALQYESNRMRASSLKAQFRESERDDPTLGDFDPL